jgi:hypothetical protein
MTVLIPWWALASAVPLLITFGWCAAYSRLWWMREDIASQQADLDRLLGGWTPPAEPRQPGSTPWPVPLHPREHEVELPRRDRERQLLAFADRGALPAAVPAPPRLRRPDPLWEPHDTGVGRRWVPAAARPTWRQRLRTVVRLRLALAKRYVPQTGTAGRHRADLSWSSRPDEKVSVQPTPEPTVVKVIAAEPHTDDFDRAFREMEAGLLATIARGGAR